MQYLSTYWMARDGHIVSEEKLIGDTLSGQFAGKVLVLDDYNGRGSIVPFRHSGMKMIRYDAWTKMVILVIHQGNPAKASLSELFCRYPCVCLPTVRDVLN